MCGSDVTARVGGARRNAAPAHCKPQPEKSDGRELDAAALKDDANDR